MPKNQRQSLHHRGRLHQVPIYLGKQFRSFLYVNDWKMLPMAAVIAALVAMVIRKYMFISSEGTLLSAFALSCVAIWNGCFNSIQVICRDRAIIKREHRSGMHITSYIFSNMVYQALLCLAQTAITMFVCQASHVKFPTEGFMTPWLIVDIGITVFLITFASDMLSLVVSSIAHTTTAAMTVMPFVLIFQLVFSGSIFPLPAWAKGLSKLTISNYGLTAITAQADYNHLPMNAAWDNLSKITDSVIEGDLPVSTVLDTLANNDGVMKNIREKEITIFTPAIANEILNMIFDSDAPQLLEGETSDPTPAEPDAITATPTGLDATVTDLTGETTPPSTPEEEILPGVIFNEDELTIRVNTGTLIDKALSLQIIQDQRGKSIHYSIRVSDLFDLVGRDKVEKFIKQKTSEAMYKPEYTRTEENIKRNWAYLIAFCLLFAALATISLEFIDKDKR